jgi:hypothetical protein
MTIIRILIKLLKFVFYAAIVAVEYGLKLLLEIVTYIKKGFDNH